MDIPEEGKIQNIVIKVKGRNLNKTWKALDC